MDVEATCKALWEYCQDQFDDEDLERLSELVLPRIEYLPSVTVIHPELKEEPVCKEPRIPTIHHHEPSSDMESSTRRQMDRPVQKDSAQEVKKSETELIIQPNKAQQSVQISGTVSSCSGCGLHCTHQLRACVNMIQVMPSVTRVKAKDIRGLTRTTKRKIQQHWVPQGVFGIKEQMSNSIDIKDACVKPHLPQWRKRRRRTPSTSDSHD